MSKWLLLDFCIVLWMFVSPCGEPDYGTGVSENTLKGILCLDLSHKQLCWYNLVDGSEMEMYSGCLSSTSGVYINMH